jgi:hypothetical protein
MKRENISIFLLSIAIIGFQLAIIHLLSYSQWHHFAYLAVSVAMLGFGSSGVILAVWANFFRKVGLKLIPWLFIATGLFMFISPILLDLRWFRFDTFLIFTSNVEIVKLLLSCFILFLPFLSGAMVIGLFFMIRSKDIPMLYAWNLAGSALGGVLLVILANYLFPMNLVAIFGFWSIAAGLVLFRSLKVVLITSTIAMLGCFLLIVQPIVPITSEFKSLSKVLLIPETRITQRSSLPQGTLEMVKSDNLRQANGLSLLYYGKVPLVDIAFLNAQDYFAFEKDWADSSFYTQNLFAFPYQLYLSPKTLMLQPKSTFFPLQALLTGSKEVTIVEPVRPIADSLTTYPAFDDRVKVVNAYPREFLINRQQQWQCIVFPSVGSFGGAGLSAIKEEYLFTTNAIVKAFGLLSDGGVLVFSSYMDNPPRYSLKLFSSVVEAARLLKIDPQDHILSIRSWNSLLVLLKQDRFTFEETEKILRFVNEYGFDPVSPVPVQELNLLPDSTFQYLANQIISSSDVKDLTEYPFNLKPPSDNSPFFSQFIKIQRFAYYFSWLGTEGAPFLELGYLIVWASFAVCLLLALFAIAFPMLISLKNRSFVIAIWLYFSFLGLAYMLVEVALIQRSILVVGNPIMSSALIIGAILCFSAIGSYYSSFLQFKKGLYLTLSSITFFILLLILLGNMITSWLVGLPFTFRIAFLVVLIAPLSLLMGIVFPLGMRYLHANYSEQIPIAWGVNGFFSVLAAPIATIIAVEKGFSVVFALSAMLYFLCLPIVLLMLRRKRG